MRGLGRSQAAWTIGPSTRPTGLEATLRGRGFVDYDEAPLEPIATSMALMHEPPPPRDPAIGIEPVVTIEQLRSKRRGAPHESSAGVPSAPAPAEVGS